MKQLRSGLTADARRACPEDAAFGTIEVAARTRPDGLERAFRP